MTVGRPLLRAGGDVFDLLLVVDEGVVGDTVVFGTSSEVNTHDAALEMVVFDDIEQRVVDEQRLALGTANHTAVGGAAAHVADDVVAQFGIGDVVHEDAIAFVLLGAIANHRQLAALHQGITGARAAGGIAQQLVVVGIHVVHAVAQVFQGIALQQVAIGGVDVDAIAGQPHVITYNPRALHGIQMNTITAILGANARVAFDVIVNQADIMGAVHPDAEAGAFHAVMPYHRPPGLGADEHR
ncbi:hypothetical protein SRABI06_04202 [Pseudomonas brassicacearum]|nr:hypothetical protein SRABI06_04202 [Pseudomonas brassicacearum]